MMLSRRRFLGYGGAGMLAIAAGCSPANLNLLPSEDEVAALKRLPLTDRVKLAKLKNNLLGYPINMNTPPEAFFAWRKQLNEAGIGLFAFNNVGNPFKESPIPYNTHEFEREVIQRFGKRYAFPSDDTWGFLSHSGTDSNMHGMYMGRTILNGRTGRLPKAYFTKEAHYSVQILRDLLGLETVFVDTLPDGGMNPNDLAQKLAANRSQPALVIATIGTTFKGAVDSIDRIQDALKGHPSYLHLDAALFGGYLPFTPHADEVAYRLPGKAAARYDSIAVSCHKFFGFPAPAGLFITTQSHFDEFNALFTRIHNPEYIHHVPGTITCSRDSVKPAEFYFFSSPEAMAKLTEDAQSMLHNSAYFLQQIQSRFPKLEAVRANDLSNTIYFKNPGEKIVKKYSLATMHLEIERQQQDYAHVVVMPHVNRQVIDAFMIDLKSASVNL